MVWLRSWSMEGRVGVRAPADQIAVRDSRNEDHRRLFPRNPRRLIVFNNKKRARIPRVRVASTHFQEGSRCNPSDGCGRRQSDVGGNPVFSIGSELRHRFSPDGIPSRSGVLAGFYEAIKHTEFWLRILMVRMGVTCGRTMVGIGMFRTPEDAASIFSGPPRLF